ncbi:transposable element Tcb2 transposase [Trichonephila clavipes]|nr:transposable element Tcb2 transposase [Trichonephila clavipes]
MVWAAIMINGRTRLHVVANGTMTCQRYSDEVLLPHVRLFRGAVGDKFVFMDDNATCHRTLTVQDCLDTQAIQRLVWSARSPDLNPIENVWDALGRQVAGRNYPPTNKNTLIRALTEEWDKLPLQLLDNVVQSMIYGDKDPDGFYRGESNGRVGLVPGNMVSEVQLDDSGHYNDNVTRPRSLSHMPMDDRNIEYQTRRIKKMVAMYDYDPQEISPNVDSEVRKT